MTPLSPQNNPFSGFRYYNSSISIWLSVDPLSDKYPGVSPYVYCGNNPVGLKDPNGREMEFIDEVNTSRMVSEKNTSINNIGLNIPGGDPPKWWQKVKSTYSSIKQHVVSGLEAADKFCQSDVVGRVIGGLSQINPIVALTNAAITVKSDQDMFGNPATTTDKVVSVAGAGFTVVSEGAAIVKGAKYVSVEAGKKLTTAYSVGSTIAPKSKDENERK